MTKEEFIELFVEELEIEDVTITPETELKNLDEWDSMGFMITIGLVNSNLDKVITSKELESLVTLNDLLQIVGLA